MTFEKQSNRARGATLLECVLALALVAFALPVVMIGLSESHQTMRALSLHGQAQRVLQRHVDELTRDDFADRGKPLVWAHADTGACLGKVDENDYREGLKRLNGHAVRYLVVVKLGELEPTGQSPVTEPVVETVLEPVHITLEHPAAAPAQHRKRLEFHTQLQP